MEGAEIQNNLIEELFIRKKLLIKANIILDKYMSYGVFHKTCIYQQVL